MGDHRAIPDAASRRWGLSRLAQLALAVIGCGVAPMAAAFAQAAPANNPAATVNGVVPSAQGNVWNGMDHQPTQSEVPPMGNTQQQQQVNKTLDQLDNQLMNQPMPKVPNGAPPVSSKN